MATVSDSHHKATIDRNIATRIIALNCHLRRATVQTGLSTTSPESVAEHPMEVTTALSSSEQSVKQFGLGWGWGR